MLTNKKDKKFRGFSKKIVVEFQNFRKSNFDGGKFIFENLIINFSWGQARSHKKNLGPIGSAVLTFIGHRRTDRQTDKQSIYIDSD